MTMRLIGSLTSPFVRKIRVFALEHGIELETLMENPRDLTSEARKYNPAAKIPVLLSKDLGAIHDSGVIMEYLDALGPNLLDVGMMRFQLLCLQSTADALMDSIVTRLMESKREEAYRSEAVIAKEEERVAAILGALNKDCVEGKRLSVEHFGFAELCVACALHYCDFRYPHDWRGRYPELASWFALFSERDSFKQTAPPQ